MRRTILLLALLMLLAPCVMAQAPSAFPYAFPVPNDSVTGTTQFTLTKINASGNAIIMTTSDTSGFKGVCVANCGKVGTAWLAFAGLVPIIGDGTTTIQHYVTISVTTGGDVHDTGATTFPSVGAVIGQVQIGAAGGAAALILLNPELVAQSVISGVPVANQYAQWVSATQIKGVDFSNVVISPSANCNNATGGPGWSIGSGGTASCRAGTNNLGGFVSITDTAATFAQFNVPIPEDWDSATNPFIRMQIASIDTTSGHTIIPQIKVSCEKGDGTTTDDVAFNAAHSLSTITLNATANQFWSTSNVQLNGTDITGCVAGAMMIVQVGRATDTATNAEFYSATLTFPRLALVQAN
jgi:hypothetical protein